MTPGVRQGIFRRKFNNTMGFRGPGFPPTVTFEETSLCNKHVSPYLLWVLKESCIQKCERGYTLPQSVGCVVMKELVDIEKEKREKERVGFR